MIEEKNQKVSIDENDYQNQKEQAQSTIPSSRDDFEIKEKERKRHSKKKSKTENFECELSFLCMNNLWDAHGVVDKTQTQRKLALKQNIDIIQSDEKDNGVDQAQSFEQIYEKNYSYNFDESLQRYKNLDFSNNLEKHNINPMYRAYIIDWLVGVSYYFLKQESDSTFFRAVSIQDKYLKYTNDQIDNNQLQLVSIVCLFLAQKMEFSDSKISMVQVYDLMGQQKYEIEDIKQMELQILQVLKFDVGFPNAFIYLKRQLFKIFGQSNEQLILNIKELSIYVLKMALHEYNLLRYHPQILSYSAIKVALDEYLEQLKQDKINNFTEKSKDFYLMIVKKYQQLSYNIHTFQLRDCTEQIKQVMEKFIEGQYDELQNLKIYCS